MAVTLVEITAWDPVAGAAVVLRTCNVDDHRVTRLNGQRWWPVLARAPQRRLDLFDGDFSGQIGIGIGDLEITTIRSAAILANAPRYSWGERAVTVWQGPLGGAWGDYVQVFTGLTRPASGSNGRLRIGLRPDDRWLDKPLLAIYAGTGSAEGPAALKGVPKPLAFGAPQFVPGVLINSALNIWQLHGAGSVQAVPQALDRLARFGGGAFAGNDASYAALAGATIAAGSLRTCLALGLVRFGAPAAVPSFWVEGDNSSAAGWVRRPGAIIKRIAEIAGATAGQINGTSLAALDTWAATLPGGGNLSLYLGEQTTARDIIQQIAASCNAAAGVGFDGKLFVARAGIGSPAFTLAADGSRTPAVADVQLLETSAPFWRQAIAAEPTWRVHNEGEYGVIGVADQISYPDGTLVSTLQPADAGATVGAVAGTNLRDSGGRTLTDGEISNTAQRVAVRQWAFNNQSLNGWSGVAYTGAAPTVTAGSQFATFTANSSDCSLLSPDLLSVDGRVGRYLRLILSATAALSAGMRNVEVYFSTDAYAPIDGTRSKNGDWIPANHPTNGAPFEVLLDMHSLTAGGNAWRDEIVRRVRIDFDGTIPETIRIHEISMVYLGTATVGAPSGTPVGAYADSASIAPAVASAATTAQWPSVTGTGRPADNATRNNVTYSATAPASPVDGDLWVDTSGTFAVFKLRSGGAWLTGANALTAYNGLTGRPVALADINTTESSKLAGIAPGADVTSANTSANSNALGGTPAATVAGNIVTAGTTAQWPNVTGTGRPADNATNTAAPNANRVQNSLFETGTNNAEWGTYGDGGVTANPATLSTFGGFPSTVISGFVPNNTARVILSSNRTIPVTAGETIFVGVGANTGATTVVTAQVLFMNASNAYITEIGVGAVAVNTNGRSTGFITVPAGATQGVLRVQLSSTGSGAVSATIYQPMVSGAVAGQTLLPAFTRGLNALDGADVTAQNTSANSNALGGTAAATVANNISTAGTTALWPNVTGTGRPADNATNTAPPNANRVPFSRMEGNQGWQGGTTSPSGVTGIVYFAFEGRRAAVAQATASAAGQLLLITPTPLDDPQLKVEPGERLSISFRVGGLNVSGWQLNFRFRRADNSIGEVGVVAGTGVNWTVERQTVFFDVPSDARLGTVKLYVFSAGAGPYDCLISEPMISGAISGQTLHPGFTPGPNSFDGADVTAQNTAAAIAGQAWAATNGAQALVDNRLVAVGSNIVVNSEFTRSTYGFRFAANTGVGPLLTVNGGVNLSADWSGIKNVLWASVATSGAAWNAAGEADPFSTRGNWNGGNMTEQRQFGLPVKNGDVVYARCLLARHRCNTRLYLLVFDKDGNYLPSTSTNWTGGRDGGAGGGNPANFDVIGGTHPITHANAATALMMWRMLSTSQADPYIFMAEPAMGVLPAGQTAMPPYQVGNSDPLADRTADNTAANANALGGTAAATVAGNITTAQATANSKNRTFTGAATPVGAQAGDYWSIPGEQRLRRWNGTAWEVQLEFIANARTSFAVSLPTTSSFAQLGVGTLGVGPNGTTQVSATITYSPQSGGSGPRSGAIELTIDWRPVPGTGSWTQIGSSQTGSTATRADDLAPGEPGEITIGTVTIVRTLAGPVSVANNEFRVTGRLTGNAMQGTPNNAIISWVP